MKIAILTLIGEYNYGNLLQSYALQTILQRFGHNSVMLNRRVKSPTINLYFHRIISFLKSLILRYLFRQKNRLIINPFSEFYDPYYNTDQKELKRFVKENIYRTIPLRSSKALQDYVMNHHFDVVLVGSDQVWREECAQSIEEMFLSFIQNSNNIKRIAYAASFGVDKDYISKDKMAKCIDLMRRFDAISVREKSAVIICKEHFCVNAMHVLDPTMLLTSKDYMKLCNKKTVLKSDGDLLIYILDNNDGIEKVIEDIAKKNKLIPFMVNAITVHNEKSYNAKFLPVECWLHGFNESKYVLTDSFHACVFSIIFNKPFICIGNKGRGNARFDSLLGMFGLENRLIDDESNISKIMNEPIDWVTVNSILDDKRMESMSFLKRALIQ